MNIVEKAIKEKNAEKLAELILGGFQQLDEDLKKQKKLKKSSQLKKKS